MKFKYLLAALCLFANLNVIAQNGKDGSVILTPIYNDPADNICGVLGEIINDAPDGFIKTKGRELETNGNTAIWTANIGVPGAVTSSLMFTTTWQYEGVMYLGTSADDMAGYYSKYKKLLEECLAGRGYEHKSEPATASKLEKYPEQTYTKPSGDMPPVSMKVDFAENTGTYSITINVWQQGG